MGQDHLAHKQLDRDSNVSEGLLESLVTTDLRENLPPQLLAVVTGVLKLVEHLEVPNHELDSKPLEVKGEGKQR